MIKRAALERAILHRMRIDEIKGVMSLVKSADDVDYIRRRRRLKTALFTLFGAALGARTGITASMLSGSRHTGRNALIGSGMGALAGLGIGAADSRAREWAGMDPMAQTVSIART